MALSAETKEVLNVAMARFGAGTEISTALDANTTARGTNATDIDAVEAKFTGLAAVVTTTSSATTTKLHTMIKALVAEC